MSRDYAEGVGAELNKFEPNKEAVIAIQGGGVYGLTLLGQLQSVIEEHGYVPLAFAGTSAGAIVATLAWAGFSPSEIRDEWVTMVKEGVLPKLLDPPKLKGFDLDKLSTLGSMVSRVLSDVRPPENASRIKRIGRLCAGPSRWSRVAKLSKTLLEHYPHKGFFTGDTLENKIDELLRKKISVPESIVPRGEPLRFHHIIDLMRQQHDVAYHPPLLMTATNLSRARLEIISSVHSNYANVPIAKAVRASAGFPVFFTPQEIAECPDGGWFVDGGLISNFPIWTFSDAFRSEIQQSYIYDLYGHIGNRPWIRIGLRVVDDVEPSPDLKATHIFFRSLVSMLTGGSRNQLEEVLAKSASRSIIIKQPYSSTEGPENVLDINALTEEKVKTMVNKGREFADGEFRKIGTPTVTSIDSPHLINVQLQLQDLVERCTLVMAQPMEDLSFRANVFLPVLEGDEHKMKLVVSYNMEEDEDKYMEFPDLESGATGFCYRGACPIVCNLEAIAALRNTNPEHYKKLFGMDARLQGRVRRDRTWLISVPIFDPFEIRFGTKDNAQTVRSKHKGAAFHGLETEIHGPVLGTLNLDSGWNYDKLSFHRDPDQHFSDRRVRSISAIMQAVSFKIARELTGEFPTH